MTMPTSVTTREGALDCIRDLAVAYELSLADIAARLGAQQIDTNRKSIFTLTRVFSCLGGIFILSGIAALIAMSWEAMGSFMHVFVLLGPGLVCYLMANLSASQGKAGHSVSALTAVSALLQASGLVVACVEFFPHGDRSELASLAINALLAAQYGLAFTRWKLTPFLFFLITFGMCAFVSLGILVHMPETLIEAVAGASVVGIAYGLNRTRYASLSGFGYGAGSLTLLWMGFDVLRHSPFELLYLGVAAFMIWLSTVVASRTMLVTSALSLFCYLSYFTEEHFANSYNWPFCLMLLGGLFFGLGHVTLRLSRKIA